MDYILVTGAYGGMGRATVKTLLDMGYGVIALDKTVGEGAQNLTPVQVDITDQKSIDDAFDRVKTITDNLYAIIHFAGVYMLDSLIEIEPDAFERAFNINVFGAYRINKTFAPLLKNGSKIIITTSELAPLYPLPFTGLYAVTKGALDKYAYSLRMEMQLLGVRVAVVRAGAVDTGMLGISTDALDRFCDTTKLYSCNANRFKSIVNRVESRKIAPEKLAKKIAKAVCAKRMKYVYNINRNPLLLMLNILPKRLQTWIIKLVLK